MKSRRPRSNRSANGNSLEGPPCGFTRMMAQRTRAPSNRRGHSTPRRSKACSSLEAEIRILVRRGRGLALRRSLRGAFAGLARWALAGLGRGLARRRALVGRARDRREWLTAPPGRRELLGSRALLLGYGAIGQLVEARLLAFGVEVAKVRRSPGAGVLGPDAWRARLGEFVAGDERLRSRVRAGAPALRCPLAARGRQHLALPQDG